MLDERRSLHLGFQLHKIVHGPKDASLSHIMIPAISTGRAITRGKSSNKMVIPKLGMDIGQKGIAFRGPSFWNKLPYDLKITSAFMQFK